MEHALLTAAVALLAAVLAHRFAGGPGLASDAYVVPVRGRPERSRPWWRLGFQLSSTFSRRWLRTRFGRRTGARLDEADDAVRRRDGTLLLPGRRDAAHARAATHAALLAGAATVGTLGVESGSAWAVPPLSALAAISLGLLTVRPGIAFPLAASVLLLPLSGVAAAVAAGIAGAVAVAGTVRRRRAAWARVGTLLTVALIAEAAWRLSG